MEAIATRYGYNAEGGSKNFKFSTEETHSDLHDYITLERGACYPSDGFFLRAESFYNVATEIDRLGVERAYGGRSLHTPIPRRSVPRAHAASLSRRRRLFA